MEETTPPDVQDATLNTPDPTTETVTTTDSSETQETTTTTEQQAQAQQSFDDLQAQIRRLEASLKKANAEAKTHRLERDELKKFKDQTEVSTLSENERRERDRQALEKQLAEAQERESKLLLQIQEDRNYSALERAGRSLGISDQIALSDAIKLIDMVELDHDDNGRPTNAEDVMKRLVKSRPWLVSTNKAAPVSAGGATNPGKSRTSFPSEITQEYYKQILETPGAYEALSPEQKAKLAQWTTSRGRR